MAAGEWNRIFYDLEEIDFTLLVVIVLAAWLGFRLIDRLVPALIERLPGRLRPRLLPIIPLLRLAILVWAVFELAALVIDPKPQNIFAILGAFGLAVGFAFKDYLASVIAGIVTLYERPYRLGDWVEIDGAYGEIVASGLRAIRIRTAEDSIVTVPHGKLWTQNITNANDGARDHMCLADFYLDPEHSPRQVQQALRDVALSSPYLQLDRTVTVTVREKPWGTHYRLNAYPIDGRSEYAFITDLTVRGKEVLQALGARSARSLAFRGEGGGAANEGAEGLIG